jgi:hypothetical protein
MQNVPLFHEKQEGRITATLGGNKNISSAELQAAYSVTDHCALICNFMAAKGGKDTSKSWAKGQYIDAAIGYYKPFQRFCVFEIYGGAGISNQHHQYENNNIDNGFADLSFAKIFIQPAVGITFSYFDIALSTRICRLSFYKTYSQINTHNSSYDDFYAIGHSTDSYLIEPALTFRGSWKTVKIQLQFSLSQNLNNPDLKFEKSNVSLGLHFALLHKNKTIPQNKF